MNQYLLSFPEWYRVPEKKPISGNNTWICHYFGRRRGTKKCAKQFWSFTILYNTCSCSLNNTVWEFWFFSQTATILRDAAKIKLLHYDGPENLFSLHDVENFEREISCFLQKKTGYILKLLINSFFDEEKHFCKSTFSCQNFIVIVDL